MRRLSSAGIAAGLATGLIVVLLSGPALASEPLPDEDAVGNTNGGSALFSKLTPAGPGLHEACAVCQPAAPSCFDSSGNLRPLIADAVRLRVQNTNLNRVIENEFSNREPRFDYRQMSNPSRGESPIFKIEIVSDDEMVALAETECDPAEVRTSNLRTVFDFNRLANGAQTRAQIRFLESITEACDLTPSQRDLLVALCAENRAVRLSPRSGTNAGRVLNIILNRLPIIDLNAAP